MTRKRKREALNEIRVQIMKHDVSYEEVTRKLGHSDIHSQALEVYVNKHGMQKHESEKTMKALDAQLDTIDQIKVKKKRIDLILF